MLRTIKYLDLSGLDRAGYPGFEINYSVITISPAQAGDLVRELMEAIQQVEGAARPELATIKPRRL